MIDFAVWQNAAVTMRLCPGEFCTLTDIRLLFKRETTCVLLLPDLLAAHFRKGKNYASDRGIAAPDSVIG